MSAVSENAHSGHLAPASLPLTIALPGPLLSGGGFRESICLRTPLLPRDQWSGVDTTRFTGCGHPSEG